MFYLSTHHNHFWRLEDEALIMSAGSPANPFAETEKKQEKRFKIWRQNLDTEIKGPKS